MRMLKAYDKNLQVYLDRIKSRVLEAYEDDLGRMDLTTSAIVKPEKVKAVIRTNENGILGGVYEAKVLFESLGVNIVETVKEGGEIKKGDAILELEGDPRMILQGERTALNFLMRSSGIATETRKLASETKAIIVATRKTGPGSSYSDKRAVKTGGGYPLRMGLFDQYLIKDNHIVTIQKELGCTRIEAIRESLKRVKKHNRNGKAVEIEVCSLGEALEAAKENPDVIMLDNLKPSEIKRVVKKLKDTSILLEASGGITMKNIKEYDDTGIDAISIGYVTHSPRALDISLELVQK